MDAFSRLDCLVISLDFTPKSHAHSTVESAERTQYWARDIRRMKTDQKQCDIIKEQSLSS